MREKFVFNIGVWFFFGKCYIWKENIFNSTVMENKNHTLLGTIREQLKNNFSINFLFVIIILMTMWNILSNYIFTRNVIKEVNSTIENYEYSKAGGEENYKILREIQKEQTISYLNDISNQDPEYIEDIKSKIDPNYQKQKKLTQEEIEILKQETFVLWKEDAPYSLIEFSHFACKYCTDMHTQNIIPELLGEYQEKLNYLFKNMVNKKESREYTQAWEAKCIFSQTKNETYLKYVDELFSFSLEEKNDEKIKKFLSDNNLDWKIFENCSQKEIDISLEKEFWQWIYLWVKSTPTFVVLDNTTWKYIFLEWYTSKEDFQTKYLNEFLKK